MRKFIGWFLLIVGLLLTIDQIWALNVWGFDAYGFWGGLLNFTLLPVTFFIYPLLRIFFASEWGDLFYTLFLTLMVFIAWKLLQVKNQRIVKLNNATVNEKELPQPNGFDKFRAFLAVPFSYYLILFSSGLTILIAVLLIGLIYYIESSISNTIHTGILFLIGLGAVIGVISGIYAMIQGIIKRRRLEIAVKVNNDGSNIFRFVDEVASDLKAQAPDNIIISFAPDFHVDQAKASLIGGEKISGRTLTVGVIFLKYLSKQEFKAIVAHELSHFTGGDTSLSLYVYPTYRSLKVLSDSLAGMFDNSGNESSSGWTSVPNIIPYFIISKFYELFAKLMARIDRIREARADMIAASVYGSNVFSSALTKVAQYQTTLNQVYFNDYWNLLTKHEKVFTNYFDFFSKTYLKDKDVKKIMEQAVTNDNLTGDFDSHTSVQGRFNYLPENHVSAERKEGVVPNTELNSYEKDLSEKYGLYIQVLAERVSAVKTKNEEAAKKQSSSK